VPLRAARDGFDALAFADLAGRARQELRASGESSRRRTPEAWDQLTPQEIQIARMAAAGMSNRQIGMQLYISHRTVGYHLYQMFPKLGIASRSQLHAALVSLIGTEPLSPLACARFWGGPRPPLRPQRRPPHRSAPVPVARARARSA
jgi:DNA-binding CsgD family transcriptional regulator